MSLIGIDFKNKSLEPITGNLTVLIPRDAFSSGQIGSKLWLCSELELLGWSSKLTQVYGGWVGLLPFLVLSRGLFQVEKIISYDIDPVCQSIADMMNENWVWQNYKFKAETLDCNTFNGPFGDLIINTSTEHFDNLSWYRNIPRGTRVILQGNNMNHEDHIVHSNNLESFLDLYKLDKIFFKGQKDFIYPSWSFTRFMVIGIK